MLSNRSSIVVVILMVIAALFGCQCGAPAIKPGPVPNPVADPGNSPTVKIEGDPAEKAAIETINKHGGGVKQEGGRVVEIHLFRDTVNDDTLKDFVPLAKTRILKMTGAKITSAGIKHLAGMSNLTDLDLAYCKVDAAGLKEIAALKQLKVLNLSGMKATGADLSALAPLTQLEELIVSGNNNLGDAAGINIAAQFKGLKKLDIDNTDLKDAGLAAIAGLPELRYLSIHGNLVLTKKGFAALPKAKKLDGLIIGFTFRDDSAKAIGACTNLRVLRLFHCEITDKGFKELGNLNQLTELEVRRGSVANVTDAVIEEFKKTHPNCKVKGGP